MPTPPLGTSSVVSALSWANGTAVGRSHPHIRSTLLSPSPPTTSSLPSPITTLAIISLASCASLFLWVALRLLQVGMILKL